MAKAKAVEDLTQREELVVAVQEQLGLKSKLAAKNTVDAVLKALADTLATNGKTVGYIFRVHELATFKVAAVSARNRKNPRSGEIFPVPAHTKLTVKLAKNLRELDKPKVTK